MRLAKSTEMRERYMKSWMMIIGGVCAAAAGWIVLSTKRVEPVQELAQQLENAWADHHTRA